MQATYWMPVKQAAAAGLAVALVALLAADTSSAAPTRAAAREPAGVVLAPGAGYGESPGAAPVRKLQRRLERLGYGPGPVDGLYGPLTEAAVERFQRASGLQVDGIVGPLTRQALRAAAALPMGPGAGYGHHGGSERVRNLQRRLERLGYGPGPVDGLYGPLTEAAVERFQRASELRADGVVGPQSRRALVRAERSNGGAPDLRADEKRQRQRERRAQATPSGQPATGAPVAERPSRAPSIPAAGDLEPDDSARAPLLTAGLLVVALAALATAVGVGVAADLSLSGPRAILTKGWARARSLRRFRDTARALVLSGPRCRRRPERPVLEGNPHEAASSRAESEPIKGASPPPAARHAKGRGDDPMRALGYVSAAEPQALPEREQVAAIVALCDALGWPLGDVVREVEQPQGNGLRPPGLDYALERLANGEGSCLVVAQLGRLSRSAAELARILDWLKEHGIRLVAIDVELDTATPAGRLAADALISVGALELEQLAPRSAGRPPATGAEGAGSRRPAVHDLPALRKHIVAMRSSGMTLQAIADRLNAEGVPTLRGGRQWRPSSVQAAVGYRRPGQGPAPTHRATSRGVWPGGTP
jgi:peptidoglycan hydrolase-like protein with peptidoglycan-binding domain/DNA invertase Pin-like site-specific DNA recombinase